jgi:hypothetical protein
MKLILLLIASTISGILYRMGGSDAYNTKARDIGVATIATITILFLGVIDKYNFSTILSIIFSFGLLFGSLTTYWKKKGTDAKWWNWAITGAAYSLSAMPIAWATGHWLGFGIRSIVITGLTVLWSELVNNAVIEEFGRGALIVITLPLLLI